MPDTLTGLRQRAVLLMGAGVLLAALTGWSAYRVVSRYQAELVEARTPPDEMTVLAATRDMGAGTVIAKKDVVSVVIPRDGAPADKLFPDATAVLGQVLQSPILAGEPLRRERFGTSLGRRSLADDVTPGMRAVTVEVSRAAGVGGNVRPGDHVDVIVTIRPDDEGHSAAWVTETILQGVRVLDDGEPKTDPIGNTKAPPSTPVVQRTSWMTLELGPSDAEKLALASARGELHVALRNGSDADVVAATGPLQTGTLVGLGTTAAAAAPAAPERVRHARPVATPDAGYHAEVIQGSHAERQTVMTETADGT